MICTDINGAPNFARLISTADDAAMERPAARPAAAAQTASPLALFAAHTVPDEISHAARARSRVRRVAALSRELTALFKPGSHTRVFGHDAGPFLGASWDRPAILRKCR
jgi:hypothetical protein